MKLLVGLGNPGGKYINTRHNAGFLAADKLADVFSFEPFKEEKKFKAQVASGQIGEEKVLLAKPQTYMNLSGQSVSALMNFYKLEPDDAIILYDDVDIDFGELRIRSRGSAGGHNGIKSIIGQLGTEEFIRVRIGIKPIKPFRGSLESYVLGQITENEKASLDEALSVLPDAIETFLEEGIEVAMNDFN